MDSQIEQLKEYVDNSNNIVAITGAGISLSAGGLSFDDSSSEDMHDLMALGSEDVLKNDSDRYYHLLDQAFLHSMLQCGPSPAHKVLAQLEAQGKLISKADLILIIGANGNYADAYWHHRNRKAPIVQINPGNTGFDRMAALNIHRDADSVLTELMEAEAAS